MAKPVKKRNQKEPRNRPADPERTGGPPGGSPTGADPIPEVDDELTAKLQAALAPLDILGLRAEVRRGVAYLRGVVGTPREREAAETIANDVPGVTGLVSGLVVENAWPAETLSPSELEPMTEVGGEEEMSGYSTIPGTEPDLNAMIGTNDPAAAADGNEPYYPPTDPLVRPIKRDEGDLEVLGWFAPGSMNTPIEPDDLPIHYLRGDEEIEEDVARALAEDAETMDLDIRVVVRRGTAYLYGRVKSIDEVELAEEVAGRVAGVRDVHEEIEVAGF